jgi:hypothetical protein
VAAPDEQHVCIIKHRLLLWLRRHLSDQRALRIADGVWGACVYVTFPAKSLATAITVRQPLLQG